MNNELDTTPDWYLEQLHKYGINVINKLMEYFISIEAYEECQKVKEAIAKHNELANDDVDVLGVPTSEKLHGFLNGMYVNNILDELKGKN